MATKKTATKKSLSGGSGDRSSDKTLDGGGGSKGGRATKKTKK